MPTLNRDFPGGNLIVEDIHGSCYRVRQDRISSREWWFYWAFQVQDAGGRDLRFEFTDGDVFTRFGPCWSPDGQRWRWLGADVVVDNGFSYSFEERESSAYFSLAPTYTRQNLTQFLTQNPVIEVEALWVSEMGRQGEMLSLRSRQGRHTAAFLARTYAF